MFKFSIKIEWIKKNSTFNNNQKKRFCFDLKSIFFFRFFANEVESNYRDKTGQLFSNILTNKKSFFSDFYYFKMSLHTRTTKTYFLEVELETCLRGPQAREPIVMIFACDTLMYHFLLSIILFRSCLFYFPCSTTIRIIIIFWHKKD